MFELPKPAEWKIQPGWLTRGMLLMFALASVALLASVVIPAVEAMRILALLREDEEVIEPARVATRRRSRACRA